ncbi:hypothetical protein J3E71DRAFT_182561 [Bipolaris maydis]|nr:hypothetical protein J3E71DRAFT_182561 [Bipolaris maydis]
MSDPLSITASIITLIQVSVQVTVLINQFCNEASTVDTTLAGLLSDVEGFKRVLESMKETIDQDDIKSNLQSTGHTGSHWKNLARSLNDGTETLKKLYDLLDGVNKKTSLLDAQRKLIRLKSASGQIAQYREQIQSSHAALQLSLSTIILWNQVTFQKSTEKIPDKIVPTLDKPYDEFRSFGALLNAKIDKLQFVVVDPNDPDNYKLQYMTNLRECVRSAADVVATASTNLNVDSNGKTTGTCGSDFGDVFVKDVNEPMLRWFASNTVYEYEDVEAPIPAPPDASNGDAMTGYHSDTDSDIENDMIRSLFKEGKKRQGQGDLTGAVRRFQNCLTRFSSNTNYASLTMAQILTVCGVSKVELLENITDCYRALGLWAEAKATMGVKLQITEHQVGKKDALYLKDTMKLAEIMMKNHDYVDAHLQARHSLRGFKKLEDEEEAYAALLSGHTWGVQRSNSKFQSAELDPADIIQPQLPSTLDLQVEPDIAISATERMEKAMLQPHGPVEEDPPHTETDIVAFGDQDDQPLHLKKRVETFLPYSSSHSPEITPVEAKDNESRKLDQESSSFSAIQPHTLDTTKDSKRRELPAL